MFSLYVGFEIPGHMCSTEKRTRKLCRKTEAAAWEYWTGTAKEQSGSIIWQHFLSYCPRQKEILRPKSLSSKKHELRGNTWRSMSCWEGWFVNYPHVQPLRERLRGSRSKWSGSRRKELSMQQSWRWGGLQVLARQIGSEELVNLHVCSASASNMPCCSFVWRSLGACLTQKNKQLN